MTNVIVVSYCKYTIYYILVINVTMDGYWEDCSLDSHWQGLRAGSEESTLRSSEESEYSCT